MVRGKLPRDAFIDESIRGQMYYLCAVLVPLDLQSQLRRDLRKIANRVNRRRLHFNHQTTQLKNEVLKVLEDKCEIVLVQAQVSHELREEVARQECMSALVLILQELGVQRMTIENWSKNRDDELTILRVRSNGPRIDFFHLGPHDEELLWCADAIAWVFGAGPSWVEKIGAITQRTIHVL